MMAKTETEYGTVTSAADMEGVTIEATGAQLYAWANRPGCFWPCSELAPLDSIRVAFDSDGLLEIACQLDGKDDAAEDLTSDELNAWSSDVLRGVLSRDHPAWFVTVGQFAREGD